METKKIEHFLLPENTNKLYREESISSIALTKEVAEKVNEIVDSVNDFSAYDLEWKHELEGRVEKGVLFMKDNLVNSLHDLFKLLYDSGDLTGIITDAVLSSVSTMQKKTAGVVSVKEYGAVGDGYVDDTEALQEAINAGVFIVIPEGTYKTTKPLTIPSAAIISGQGEKSIIKSTADTVFITTTANTVVKDIKVIGNDENTGFSVFKNKQTFNNIVLEHLAVGFKNKNSDYIGSVKFIDLYFDNVGTCFESATLTNGVTIERVVAYRFDCILKAYWIEGVGINNCFFEIGNEGSSLVKVLDGKTNCRTMSLAFTSCYIENVEQLFTGVINGVIKFDNCWLFTKESFYSQSEETNTLKVAFCNTTFGISSALSNTATLFNLAEGHTFTFENIYCMKNGAGSFTFKKGVNAVGGTVVIEHKTIQHKKVTVTLDSNGVYKSDLPAAGVKILNVAGFRNDNGSNIYCVNYTSGDWWYIGCKHSLSNEAITDKQVTLNITYIETDFIEV